MGTVLRQAGLADVRALAALGRETWRTMSLEEFSMPYSAADVALYEQEKFSEEVVRAQLLSRRGTTWIAEAGGELVAYATVGPCTLPHPDVLGSDMELDRLYVSRAYQGQGLGRQLMRTAIAWMGELSAGAQWVGVWSGNRRAQRLYRSHGFEEVGEYNFPVGRHLDRDLIMRRGR